MEQIASWFTEEGLAPDSSKEAQLCLLWRALQRTRSCLSSVTKDQDMQRSQHLAEMAEVTYHSRLRRWKRQEMFDAGVPVSVTKVRKSLEQIRFFTEHKDVLVQEIQDENDQLKDQLQHLVSLQGRKC